MPHLSSALLWRLLRWYVYCTIILWLISVAVLFYLVHSHTAASSSGLTGAHRVHAVLHSSVNQAHSTCKHLIASTRALFSHVLDTVEQTISPSGWKQRAAATGGGGAVVGGVWRVRRGVSWFLDALESFLDGLFAGVREGIDEWLAAALELMSELQQQQAQQQAFASSATLAWQQQRLPVQPDDAQQPSTLAAAARADASQQQPASASPSSPSARSPQPNGRPSGQQSWTQPLRSLTKSAMADGSVLYLSPDASSSDAFSLDTVASDEDGRQGERRVLLSTKDGLLRVTYKGHANAQAA